MSEATKTTMKMNPLNIGYLEQAKRFGLGFAITSFFGDLDTAITISAADHMLEKLNKEMDNKEEKAKKEAAKTSKSKEETKTETPVTEEPVTETKTESTEETKTEVVSEESTTEENKEDVVIERVEGEIVTDETGIVEYNDATVKATIVDGELKVEDLEVFKQFTEDEVVTLIDEATTKLSHIPPREVKLTVLGMLYIGALIDTEQTMKLIDSKTYKDEIEFLNTFTKFFTQIVMVPGHNSYMINEIYSKMKNLEDIVKYVALNETVANNDAIGYVIEKSRELMVEVERATLAANGDKDPDPVVPLVFVNKNMNLIKHQNVTKAQLNGLQKALSGVIEQYQHQFNGMNGLIELVIYNEGRYDAYQIDPGTVIGNGYNLIYTINNTKFFINIAKHRDIVAKLLQNKYYQLTPEEFQLIGQDMFMNNNIYKMVDMTKGPEILPKLTEEEFKKLGKKLSFIMNLDWSVDENGTDDKIPSGRVRFRNFKSIDDFTLVSDNKCKCPVQLQGVLWSRIIEGLTIKVTGDEIIVKYNDVTKKYEITSYNEM